MISYRRPSPESMRSFLESQAKLDFSYPASGATQAKPPAGYIVDHTRIKLGSGEHVFRNAKNSLKQWGQFDLGWVEAWPTDTPLRSGEAVAIVARLFGLWWLSACRIVYVIDELAPITRFGFAYGTLPDHAGTGEERFLLEWNQESGEVWYDILAFSRPRWLVARIGYLYMRTLQARFGRDSAAAMVKAASGRLGEEAGEGSR